MTESAASAETAPRRPLWARWAVPSLASLALLVGLVLTLLPEAQKTVGWFAYSPLTQTVFVADSGVLLTQRMVLGLTIAAVGALVLAACGGWMIARRHVPRR